MNLSRLAARLHPRRLLQGAVVAANVPPFENVLAGLYSFGLNTLLRSLAKHPELHAVYGTGSMFHGTPLYGHSDIDLILVFKDPLERAEGEHFRVASTYNRWRLFFPFLGAWSEKSSNLIFMSEVKAGFPIPASFRVRLKRGKAALLLGDPVEFGPGPARPTSVELLDELDTLVRVGVLTSERWSGREIFWRGLFEKLVGVAEELECEHVLREAEDNAGLALLKMDRRKTYFRGANAGALFEALLDLVADVQQATREREEHVRVVLTTGQAGPPERTPGPPPHYLDHNRVRASWTAPSVPLGLLPKLFYVSLDETTYIVELEAGQAYVQLRTLAKQLKKRGTARDTVIIELGPHRLLFTWQGSYVDVIPLDPIVHAPAHAFLTGSTEYSLPASIYEELVGESEQFFDALRRAYEKHTAWLPSRKHPEVFVEDDDDTIRDALDIIRALYAQPRNGVLLTSSSSVLDALRAQYPEAVEFLDLIEAYYTSLMTGARGDAPASNLYRCLHQFVGQVLAGVDEVELDDPNRMIGLTVGITTRNRATDLVNALSSLSEQHRPPDQVVVVDNGSTDNTREVVEAYADRLPLIYDYLAEASIPKARNRVLELASHEVVAFTDDDCGIPQGWLGSVERAFLRADNVGLVGGWVAHWPAEEESTVDTYYEIFHGHKT